MPLAGGCCWPGTCGRGAAGLSPAGGGVPGLRGCPGSFGIGIDMVLLRYCGRTIRLSWPALVSWKPAHEQSTLDHHLIIIVIIVVFVFVFILVLIFLIIVSSPSSA